jgi:DNA-binding CsgD family transcriptional regulator
MEHRELACGRLIDQIYDAGACPDRWPEVISSIASAAGAMGGVMFGFSKSRGLIFEYNGSLDDASMRVFTTRHLNNAWVRGMAKREVNRLVISEEIIKLRQLKQSSFHDEVLRPQHLAHGALATLKFCSDIDIQFSVHKSPKGGVFKSRDVIMLRRLLPHVCRAMGVSLRLARGVWRSTPVDSVTDRMACAAITLSAGGVLLDVNAEAERLVESGGRLVLSGSAIRFSDPSEHRRFLDGVKRVLQGESMHTLHLGKGVQHFDVFITALKAREAQWLNRSSAPSAAVLVLISEVCSEEPLRLCVGASLTDAEWRIAKMAALGTANCEIAHTLNLSRNTVKTHLRRIYEKLRVHRQSELMLLFNRHAADSHHPMG